jgi:hypothetical protein
MDYTELVADRDTDGSIKNWLNNSSIPSTTVLGEAEDWIFRRLRVRDMLALDEGTMSTSNAFVAVPAGFLASRSFYYSGTDKAELSHTTLTDIEAARTYDAGGTLATGKPLQFWVDGTNAYFQVTPDQAYAYRWWHYAQPTALGASNTSNFLTTKHPRLVRCACLAFANEFIKQDSDKMYWLKLAEGEIEAIHREDDEVRWDLDVSVVVT